MRFFRKHETANPVPAAAAQEVSQPTPTLRRVQAGDVDYGHVLAALDLPPGAERDAAGPRRAAAMEASGEGRHHEYFVLDGLDGGPVGVLHLRIDAVDPGTVTVWGAVDPVVRRYGMGQLLFERGTKRATELGATRLRATSDDQSGHGFLVDHGFRAVSTEGTTVTGELNLGLAPS